MFECVYLHRRWATAWKSKGECQGKDRFVLAERSKHVQSACKTRVDAQKKIQTHLIWSWKRFLSGYRLLPCHTLHNTVCHFFVWAPESSCAFGHKEVRNYFKEVWEWVFFFGPWFLSDIWHNLLLRSGNTIQQFRDIILNSGSQLFGPQVERTNSSSVGSGSNKDEYHFIFFIALFYLKKTGMT